jgi:hypothetical protein
MRGVQGAADRAMDLAREFLLAQAPGSLLHDVTDDPRFRHRGVDLLWERGDQSVTGVEVKGDRQGFRRKNYFFELVSNLEKDTPGCFLYSMADLLVYVFLDVQQVHCLPLKQTREWFLPQGKRFPLRTTRTKTGPISYTTVGALVPLREVKAAVAPQVWSRKAPPTDLSVRSSSA